MLQCSDPFTRSVDSPASRVGHARDSTGLLRLLFRKANEHLLEGTLADAIVLNLERALQRLNRPERT